MRSFSCTCGNQLFFDNSIRMNCKREVGWCPDCRAITDVTSNGDDGVVVCPLLTENLVKMLPITLHTTCATASC